MTEIENLPIEETNSLKNELIDKLKVYSKYDNWFSDWVTLMSQMVYKPEPKLIAIFTKNVIETNHDISDLFMCRLFHESLEILEEFMESKDYLLPLRGFYIQFKGRVGGKARSGKETYGFGVLKPHRVDSNLKYFYTNYQTKYGTSSIKVWMSLNNIKKINGLS